jgi:hypothetical protein
MNEVSPTDSGGSYCPLAPIGHTASTRSFEPRVT